MTVTITAREFNQDRGAAKKAALKEPVIITDRGEPSHVLLSAREYNRLKAKQAPLTELLAMPGIADIDFDPPRLSDNAFKPVDFS
jgi:PHD/YefM family antitoxin component YafN of YafNO toxin-antitoxin module